MAGVAAPIIFGVAGAATSGAQLGIGIRARRDQERAIKRATERAVAEERRQAAIRAEERRRELADITGGLTVAFGAQGVVGGGSRTAIFQNLQDQATTLAVRDIRATQSQIEAIREQSAAHLNALDAQAQEALVKFTADLLGTGAQIGASAQTKLGESAAQKAGQRAGTA